MTFTAFTGVAGSGKTHRLISELSDRFATKLLSKDQKILALTFMHGSRKRLDARLSRANLNGVKYECTVIDRIASKILHRWRSLARLLELGPFEEDDYDSRCTAAASLLSEPLVLDWLVRSYPIILLDEAQDLTPERLALFEILERSADLYVAADEFQCLNKELRDSRVLNWITKNNRHIELDQIRRTNQQGLLDAARAIRNGAACPLSGPGFSIYADIRGPNLAAYDLAKTLGTKRSNPVAIISPTINSNQIRRLLDRIRTKPIGQRRPFGPFTFEIETSADAVAHEIYDQLSTREVMALDEIIEALKPQKHRAGVKLTLQWAKRQKRVCGRHEISTNKLKKQLIHNCVDAARYSSKQEHGIRAMTVHGAKNREFDGVIVLWPYEISGDDEQKRRLLYNAVTRAKNWCRVICMNKSQLERAPFTTTAGDNRSNNRIDSIG